MLIKFQPFYFSPILIVFGPEMGPDWHNFESYFVLDRTFAVASRPGPFRPTFGPAKRGAIAKNTNFALDGYNRFMKPSWVRAHGLIFGKVYIVWVCAPPYSPLSSPRNRMRQNSALEFGPNVVTLSGGIFYWVYWIKKYYRKKNTRMGYKIRSAF